MSKLPEPTRSNPAPLAFRLHHVGRLVGEAMDNEIEDMPITLGQAKFLRHVVAEADGATPARLAERAGCSRANATQTLARLEKAGLVVRVSNPDDGRSVYVQATAGGRRALEQAIDAILRFEQQLRHRIGAERARELWSVLFELF